MSCIMRRIIIFGIVIAFAYGIWADATPELKSISTDNELSQAMDGLTPEGDDHEQDKRQILFTIHKSPGTAALRRSKHNKGRQNKKNKLKQLGAEGPKIQQSDPAELSSSLMTNFHSDTDEQNPGDSHISINNNKGTEKPPKFVFSRIQMKLVPTTEELQDEKALKSYETPVTTDSDVIDKVVETTTTNNLQKELIPDAPEEPFFMGDGSAPFQFIKTNPKKVSLLSVFRSHDQQDHNDDDQQDHDESFHLQNDQDDRKFPKIKSGKPIFKFGFGRSFLNDEKEKPNSNSNDDINSDIHNDNDDLHPQSPTDQLKTFMKLFPLPKLPPMGLPPLFQNQKHHHGFHSSEDSLESMEMDAADAPTTPNPNLGAIDAASHLDLKPIELEPTTTTTTTQGLIIITEGPETTTEVPITTQPEHDPELVEPELNINITTPVPAPATNGTDGNPRCPHTSEFLDGSQNLWHEFKNADGWKGSVQSIGRSISKAASSIHDCAKHIWSKVKHQFGLKKRSVHSQDSFQDDDEASEDDK